MTESDRKIRKAQGDERDKTRPQESSSTSLNEDIRARVARPHKGDVGRPKANEEIFQGSKQKELK
jgi:hypothetical protein